MTVGDDAPYDRTSFPAYIAARRCMIERKTKFMELLRAWDEVTPAAPCRWLAGVPEARRNGSYDARLITSGYYAERIRAAMPI